MDDDPSPDPAFHHIIEQAFQAVLAIAHAGSKIGDRLKPPTLLGAVPIQNLLVSRQIALLVVVAHTSVVDGTPPICCDAKP